MTTDEQLNGLMIEDGWLGEWCNIYAESEAPQEAFLAMGVGLLSSVIGPHVRVGDEFGHVWTLVTGQSAIVKKTTVLRAARKLSHQIEDHIKAEVPGADDIHRTVEIRAGTMTEAWMAEEVGAEDEVTAQRWLEEHPPGIFAAVNEADPFFADPNKATSGTAAQAIGALLALYDGQVGSNSKNTNIPMSPVSIALTGTTTPQHIVENLSLAQVGKGSLGRWMIFKARRSPNRSAWVTGTSASQLQRLDELARSAAKLVSGHSTPTFDMKTKCTPAARKAREEWYAETAVQMEDAVEAAEAEDRYSTDTKVANARHTLWARYQATALKLAAVVAVSDGLANGLESLDDLVIDEQHIRWGQDFVMYSLDEVTQYMHETSAAGRQTAAAEIEEKLLDVLEQNGGAVRQRSVVRNALASRYSSEQVEKVANAIEEVGVTVGERKNQTVYYLVDKLSEQDAQALNRKQLESEKHAQEAEFDAV